jgi:hypothetical protein
MTGHFRSWAGHAAGAFLGMLALAAPLAAQPADSTQHGRWITDAELSFTDMAGNKSLSLLSTGIGFRLQDHSNFEVSVKGSARYGKSEGDVAVSIYRGEFNLRFQPRREISPFLRTTLEHDGVRRLDVRAALAVGAEMNLLAQGPSSMTLGLALLQDYESRDLPEGSTEQPTLSSTRFNLQFRGATPLTPDVTLDHSSQIQPVAGDLSDYLLTSQTSIKVKLTRILAFQTSYTFNRDVSPLPGVEFRNDRTLTTGLVVHLE